MVRKPNVIRSAATKLAAAVPAGPRRKLGLQQSRSARHRASDAIQPRKTILWIDDYQPGLLVYRAIFEKLGFHIITAPRPALGLQLASSHHIDVVITDYEMPEMNGAALTAALKGRHPQLPVILFTGSDSLLGAGNLAEACCDKAAPLEELLATLRHILANKPGQSLQPPVLRPPSGQGQRTFA